MDGLLDIWGFLPWSAQTAIYRPHKKATALPGRLLRSISKNDPKNRDDDNDNVEYKLGFISRNLHVEAIWRCNLKIRKNVDACR